MSRRKQKKRIAEPTQIIPPAPVKPVVGSLWPILLIVLAGLSVYLNSFQGVFLFDDDRHIIENYRIRHLSPLSQHLLSRRPVVSLSLATNYAVGELNVWGYHAFNLTVHLLAGITLFGIVRRTLAGVRLAKHYARAATGLALTVALIWVVHPLNTQSVTYIIQRGESLMGLFYLLTLYCLVRGVASSRHWAWYVAAVIACGLGMGSKAVMVTAPIVALLYDRVFLAGSFAELFRRRWGLYAGLAITWSILGICGVLGGVLSPSPVGTATVGFGVKSVTSQEYALSQLGVVLHYLRLSFWPQPLCLDYLWPVARRAADFGPHLILLGTLAMATVWGLLWRPTLGFLGAWFFIILAPTSSCIPIADLAFEHRMYLPLAGVVVFAVIATHHLILIVARRLSLAEYPSLRPAAGLVIVAVALLGYATVQRNKDYQSALTMWGDVVEQRPHNARAHANLAKFLTREGRIPEAIDQNNEALRLNPGQAKAYLNLGLAMKKQRRFKEAIEQYRNALRCKPDLAEAHVGLVEVMLALGRVDEAVEHGTQAVRLESKNARARNNLGLALWRTGRVDDAHRHYRKALRLEPDLLQGHFNLGLLLAGQGKHEEAIESYRQALRINPRYADAYYSWGVVLAKQGRPDDAAQKFQAALRINPKHQMARRQLEITRKQHKSPATP